MRRGVTGYWADASTAVQRLGSAGPSERAAHLANGNAAFTVPALFFTEAANAPQPMHRCSDLSTNDLSISENSLWWVPGSFPPPVPEIPAAANRLAVNLHHPIHDHFWFTLSVQTYHFAATADMRIHDKVQARMSLRSRSACDARRCQLGDVAIRGQAVFAAHPLEPRIALSRRTARRRSK